MSNEIVTSKNLPTNLTAASFGIIDPAEKTIQGDLIKCTDGVWSSKSGLAFPHKTRMVVPRTARAVQRFEAGKPETIVETDDEQLPDIEAWNNSIPKDTWDLDLNGNPRPPWAYTFIIYLVDPRDAAIYTYISATAGAEIAFTQLESRMERMCALSGKSVVPIVELGDRIVSKRFNKKGPQLHIVDWLELTGSPTPTVRAIEYDTKTELRARAQKKLAKPIYSDDDPDDPVEID